MNTLDPNEQTHGLAKWYRHFSLGHVARTFLFASLVVLPSLGAGCDTSTQIQQANVPIETYQTHQSDQGKQTTSTTSTIENKRDDTKVAPKEPQIIQQETRLPATNPYAPNGTYTNVDGNSVPRPYVAPSIPSGASAQCRDGTYSFSQNRRGTCSHHGGVETWY